MTSPQPPANDTHSSHSSFEDVLVRANYDPSGMMAKRAYQPILFHFGQNTLALFPDLQDLHKGFPKQCFCPSDL